MRLAPLVAISTLVLLAASASCASFRGEEPVTGDAGADGAAGADGNAPDAMPPARCPGTVIVADGFDRTAVTGSGWAEAEPGSIRIDPAVGAPPPSLFTESPAGENQDHTLERADVPVAASRDICIELDLLLSVDPSSFGEKSFAEVLAIKTNDSYVYVEVTERGLVLTDNTSETLITGFRSGSWQHVVVRLPYGAGPVAVTFDDGATTSGAFQLPASPPTLTTRIGLKTATQGNPPGAASVRIDNFRMTSIAP